MSDPDEEWIYWMFVVLPVALLLLFLGATP